MIKKIRRYLVKSVKAVLSACTVLGAFTAYFLATDGFEKIYATTYATLYFSFHPIEEAAIYTANPLWQEVKLREYDAFVEDVAGCSGILINDRHILTAKHCIGPTVIGNPPECEAKESTIDAISACKEGTEYFSPMDFVTECAFPYAVTVITKAKNEDVALLTLKESGIPRYTQEVRLPPKNSSPNLLPGTGVQVLCSLHDMHIPAMYLNQSTIALPAFDYGGCSGGAVISATGELLGIIVSTHFIAYANMSIAKSPLLILGTMVPFKTVEKSVPAFR